MKLGFVGTGTITEAIVTGFLSQVSGDEAVIVSPKGAAIAARLAERHSAVTIARDNQEVVDMADVLFLAVRPQIAEEVVRSLSFRHGQIIVSLVATIEASRLQSWIDADVKITRAVPLPFVAERRGVTIVFPQDEAVRSFFAKLGTAVECHSQNEFDLLTTASALMGTYFGILEHAVGWLAGKGISESQARVYLVSLFSSLAHTAQSSSSQSLQQLRHDFSTKGGLNEQMFRDFEAGQGMKALEIGLETLLARVRSSGVKQD